MISEKRDAGANALRRGRVSTPCASYFLTLCIEPREPMLVGIGDAVLRQVRRLETEHVWLARAAVVMPDHVHLLITLGQRLTLSQAIGRLKRDTGVLLGGVGVRWQANFYDHRLRENDSVEATLRYLWLNPCHAGLASSGERWPLFYCCDDDWAWFAPTTDLGKPFPEWLR